MEQPQALKSQPLDLLRFCSALLLVGGAVAIAPHGRLMEVATLRSFWIGAGIMGAGFALSWGVRSLPLVWFWGVAIATRLLLLPMEPGDDLWRYLWEGYIQTLGFSPYHLPPNAPELVAYRPEWWGQINHPDVTAIYPPLTQLGFRLLAMMALNLYGFKLAFILADLLVCWLLCRRFGPVRSTLYAWNPMIIYTFAGGAHYDSWFILPLVIAWFGFDRQLSASALGYGGRLRRPLQLSPIQGAGKGEIQSDWFWSALAVGISVAVKWISLPILGFLSWRSLRQGRVWQAVCISAVGILPMVWSAIPFCQPESCPLIPTRSVFVAYGRSAEFIPHFVAQIWPPSLQANWIYSFPLALFVIWLLLRIKDFQPFVAWYWFGLLTLTPIVHFWYFTWMVPFAVPNQNWGVRLVSLSGFIYFVLPSRLPDWRLTTAERLFLWLPLILGWLWTTWQETPPALSSSDSHQKFS